MRTEELVAERLGGLLSVAEGPATAVEPVAVKPVEVVSESMAVGPVTTVESVAMRPVEVVSNSMAVGPVMTVESV